MVKIQIPKKVDFLVTENFEIKENEILQIYQFWTDNKKNYNYAFDQRFCLKQKLDKLFLKDLLEEEFIKREDFETKVVFIYKLKEDFKKPKSKTINCEFYLPPYKGCKYCSKKKIEKDFIYCLEKKKHYDYNGIKNCPVFKSIEEILT